MIHTDGTPTIACGAEADERLNLTPDDFRVQSEGTIVILHPLNDAARSWIDEHLYDDNSQLQGESPVWWGGGVVIDHSMVGDILTGVLNDGLTFSQ